MRERLVQGIEGRPVATLGFFVPSISLFETSADSIREPYHLFLTRARAGRTLLGLGLVATTATGAILLAHSSPRLSIVLPLFGGGAVLGVAGVIESARAENALQLAVHRYNELLPN